MKQQKFCIAPKIVTSRFLGWTLKMKKNRDLSVVDITIMGITAEDFT